MNNSENPPKVLSIEELEKEGWPDDWPLRDGFTTMGNSVKDAVEDPERHREGWRDNFVKHLATRKDGSRCVTTSS